MDEIKAILIVLAIAFAAYQVLLVVLGVGYAASGKKVKVGIAPGIIATVLAIVAVLL